MIFLPLVGPAIKHSDSHDLKRDFQVSGGFSESAAERILRVNRKLTGNM